jgi:pimeloyl-ACP methyl ester carboxylesterase
VWDIATFWPRHAHPLAPPCYAERAVPELGSRIAELTNGDPASTDPRVRTSPVIVSAHSQGSAIAVAALLRQGQAVDRVALITYGSPLDRLYRRYFPAFFPLNTTAVLADRLDHRWINLYRVTDPIGGPVEAAGECDWEVPLHHPLEGHGGYMREPYYRDALTTAQQWLSGRLSA